MNFGVTGDKVNNSDAFFKIYPTETHEIPPFTSCDSGTLGGATQSDVSIFVTITHTPAEKVIVQATGFWQTNGGVWSKINETTSINAGLQPKVSAPSSGTDLHLGSGAVWLWQKSGWNPKRFGTAALFMEPELPQILPLEFMFTNTGTIWRCHEIIKIGLI